MMRFAPKAGFGTDSPLGAWRPTSISLTRIWKPAPVIFRLASFFMRGALIAGAASLAVLAGTAPGRTQALLLVDADSGRVLHSEHAGLPGYPASVSKVMTAYAALHAVKAGRISLDSLISVSARAARQQPSKMGFPVGTRMTLDNAIKMLMVK